MIGQYQDVASELIAMKVADLKMIENLSSAEKASGYDPGLEALHIKHAQRLEEIILEIGFPTVEKVGSEAHYSALLILNHAISEPALQRKCLSVIMKLAMKNQIEASEAAMLYDRICFFENKPQKYGTQYDFDENGNLVPWEIEDYENIDQYRGEMGLPPFQKTAERMRKITEQATAEDYKIRKEKRLDWCRKVGWI